MYIRVRPRAAAVIALAASAALALAGCSSAGDPAAPVADPKAPAAASAPASSSAKSTPKADTALLARDTVDEEVRSALRTAGLDPAKGKSTAEAKGTKNPNLVDWTAVLPSTQADFALPRIGAQLEHLGWRPHSGGTATLSFEKAGWVLLVGSVKQSTGVPLRSTESLLTVNATYLGGG
ncbi:hypothetical protein [Streptomyces sp. NPDC058674]|uniref:hypothetical protein n=1 Tax=Streptomyces sp. NPDC058674 TaxID=3346592 RepID=UPI00365265C1